MGHENEREYCAFVPMYVYSLTFMFSGNPQMPELTLTGLDDPRGFQKLILTKSKKVDSKSMQMAPMKETSHACGEMAGETAPLLMRIGDSLERIEEKVKNIETVRVVEISLSWLDA
jgi:hypothetical protein